PGTGCGGLLVVAIDTLLFESWKVLNPTATLLASCPDGIQPRRYRRRLAWPRAPEPRAPGLLKAAYAKREYREHRNRMTRSHKDIPCSMPDNTVRHQHSSQVLKTISGNF